MPENIVIAGATGMIGSLVADALSARQVPFRAMIRPGADDPFAEDPLITRVDGGFDDPKSLRGALAGADRAFLLTNSSERAEQQQLAFVDAARAAGVSHLVKLSQFAADPKASGRFQRYHAAVEHAIEESGLSWTFVRPNLIMQAYLPLAPMIAGGTLSTPIRQAPVSIVDARDIAAVAAVALTEPGHQGAAYSVTGPAAITHEQIAASLGRVVGHAVDFSPAVPEEFFAALQAMHMPTWQAEGLVEDYAHYERGEAALVSPDVERVTGTPPRTFDTFADDYASALRS
jgi:uncharacterized protein YbjT (DUF2867 family)